MLRAPGIGASRCTSLSKSVPLPANSLARAGHSSTAVVLSHADRCAFIQRSGATGRQGLPATTLAAHPGVGFACSEFLRIPVTEPFRRKLGVLLTFVTCCKAGMRATLGEVCRFSTHCGVPIHRMCRDSRRSFCAAGFWLQQTLSLKGSAQERRKLWLIEGHGRRPCTWPHACYREYAWPSHPRREGRIPGSPRAIPASRNR